MVDTRFSRVSFLPPEEALLLDADVPEIFPIQGGLPGIGQLSGTCHLMVQLPSCRCWLGKRQEVKL